MFGFGKKKDLFDTLYRGAPAAPARAIVPAAQPVEPAIPVVNVSQLPNYRINFDHGEKFPGGLGPVELLFTDYWALRARSTELFERNLYARGLIRRLVTNVINTGLHLEATPEEKILGLEEDALADWAEDVENRFALWGKNPYLCDQDETRTFGSLQAEAYREALIAGDVLCVIRKDQRTGLPRVQLISGSAVQTPFGGRLPPSTKIVHGVELDAQRRHIAFWIQQADGTSKRLPAYGEKSGRRLAWLVYATDKRLDDVRGKPLLSLVLQSLKEIDRYRDSTQRKAVLNSMLAMFITKSEDKPASRVLTRGAVRRGTDTFVDGIGTERSFNASEFIPGLILDELQHGEEPKAFQTNQTIEQFGVFEEAIIQAVAWANEIPPEILRLSFSSNYSASQAAINEFKLFLNPTRNKFGEDFCSPIYEDFLLSQVLAGRVKADGFLEAFRDIKDADIYGAWISSDWSGHIKPAVDLSKLVKGYTELIAQGLITRDRAARELTGSKYAKNVQKLARENEQLAAANKPLQPEPPPAPGGDGPPRDEGDAEKDEEEDEAIADVVAQARSRRGDASRVEARRNANGRAASGAYPQA